MKKLLFLYFILIIVITVGNSAYSQNDSTQYVHYDVIYLKEGGILKGEILSFDEASGGIVFKDTEGRKYSLSREQYDYFIEDKPFPVKKKKESVELMPRKETGWEFNLGLSVSYLSFRHDFTPDDYFLNGSNSTTDLPICVKFGGGKYLNRQSYVGLISEVALLNEGKNYFNAGVRYFYQYDGYKRNVAYYIPIELLYNNLEVNTMFQVADTTFEFGSWYYPSDITINRSVQSISFSAGQGISFILNNKKSFSIELSIVKHFIISEKVKNHADPVPMSSYSIAGGKLSVIFNI